MKHQIIVRLSRFFLMLGILLGNLGPGIFAGEIDSPTSSISFPTDPFSFQPGPGQEIANSYCVICHSADYIYMQPEHSQEKWQAIITKMKRVFGCPIPQDQIAPLSIYLFQQNAISPILPTHTR